MSFCMPRSLSITTLRCVCFSCTAETHRESARERESARDGQSKGEQENTGTRVRQTVDVAARACDDTLRRAYLSCAPAVWLLVQSVYPAGPSTALFLAPVAVFIYMCFALAFAQCVCVCARGALHTLIALPVPNNRIVAHARTRCFQQHACHPAASVPTHMHTGVAAAASTARDAASSSSCCATPNRQTRRQSQRRQQQAVRGSAACRLLRSASGKISEHQMRGEGLAEGLELLGGGRDVLVRP